MKKLFLETVERAKAKYAFSVENFCIMDNHIHLMLTPSRTTSLSRIMQWILSVFAMRFNRIYGQKGHVWYDRFKSKVIDDIRQLLATFRYIAENPVNAQLVDRPSDYSFSGVRHMMEGRFHILDPPARLLQLLFPSFRQIALR